MTPDDPRIPASLGRGDVNNQAVISHTEEPANPTATPAPFNLSPLELIALPAIVAFVWRYISSRAWLPKSAAVLRKTLDETLSVYSILGRVLEHTNADRVLLLEFHNSESYASGKHFLKISATAEVTRGNISSYMAVFQSEPIVRHAMMVNRLIDAKVHYLTIDKVEPSEQFDFYAYGIQTRVQLMIWFNKEAQGILDIHYCWGGAEPKDINLVKLKKFCSLLLFHTHRRRSISEMFSNIFRSLIPE